MTRDSTPGPKEPADEQNVAERSSLAHRVNDWTWDTIDVWDPGHDTQDELDTPEAQARRRSAESWHGSDMLDICSAS